MSEVLVRPMRTGDVEAAERLSSEVFLAADRQAYPRGWPDPEPRAPAHAEHWKARTTHLLATDPAGCWAADGPDGALVGFATSLRRDGTWCLATYVVHGDLQGTGVGRRLLDAALEHSRGCLRGMLSSSTDPGAVRRYLVAGFTMHPQMFLRGRVDRAAIPPGTGEKVREGTPADTDLLESIDRARRGSGHGPDHAFLQAHCRLLVSDTTTGSGYAYVSDGRVLLLAAQNRRTAARVLWTAIADGPEEQTIGHVTAANAWAVDIGTACRLALHTSGYLALRGMDPPAPYLHHGSLL